jgi:hypothetical protein
MPAKATQPISHDVLGTKDGTPIVERSIRLQIGDHIDDATVEVLRPTHAASMAIFAHNEHSCPDDCDGDTHRPSPPPAAVRIVPAPPPRGDSAATSEVK